MDTEENQENEQGIILEVGQKYKAKFADGKDFFYKVTGLASAEYAPYQYICEGYFEAYGQRMRVSYYLDETGTWNGPNDSITGTERYDW